MAQAQGWIARLGAESLRAAGRKVNFGPLAAEGFIALPGSDARRALALARCLPA